MTTTRRLFALILSALLFAGAPAIAQQSDEGPSAVPGPALSNPSDLPKNLPDTPGPRPVEALTPAQRKERVTFLLSGYEYFPKREELARLGDDATMTALLVAMARDEGMRPMLRTRSVDALGYYDNEASSTFLTSLAQTNTRRLPAKKRRVASSMRHHAIMALAQSTGARSLGALTKLLDDGDLQIQMTAAAAIGRYAGAAGEPVLREALEKAEHPALTREIRKHL